MKHKLLLHKMLQEPARPAVVKNSVKAHWYVVYAVCIGTFMGQLDASIVTIALPHIGHSFHIGSNLTQWVSLAYMLTLLASLLLIGQVSDIWGRKLLYTWGFAIFILGSLCCGLAPDLDILLGARVLQGLGAAMLQSNSIALIRASMAEKHLTRGLGIQGAAQAIGLACGPAIGGVLISLGGWRWIFFVNIPIGVIAICCAVIFLPRTQFLHEDKTQQKFFSLLNSLLRRRPIFIGLINGLISYLVLFGILFVIPYYLDVHGISPLFSGLELSILPIMLGIVALTCTRFSWFSPISISITKWNISIRRRKRGQGHYAHKVNIQKINILALVLICLGVAELALDLTLVGRLIGLAITGGGLGLFIPINNSTVMASGSQMQAGLLGGLLNMARTLGSILGVALTSLLYLQFSHQLLPTLLVLAGITLIGLLLATINYSFMRVFSN